MSVVFLYQSFQHKEKIKCCFSVYISVNGNQNFLKFTYILNRVIFENQRHNTIILLYFSAFKLLIIPVIYVPRRDKTCLRVFRKSEAQTSLLSYADYLEIWNFACSKPRYDTFQQANNKYADQTARMRRLVCACVICKPPKTGFLASRPICEIAPMKFVTVFFFKISENALV